MCAEFSLSQVINSSNTINRRKKNYLCNWDKNVEGYDDDACRKQNLFHSRSFPWTCPSLFFLCLILLGTCFCIITPHLRYVFSTADIYTTIIMEINFIRRQNNRYIIHHFWNFQGDNSFTCTCTQTMWIRIL